MNMNDLIRDFDFYIRAIERGAALMLIISILTLRSFVTNEPFL